MKKNPHFEDFLINTFWIYKYKHRWLVFQTKLKLHEKQTIEFFFPFIRGLFYYYNRFIREWIPDGWSKTRVSKILKCIK